MSAELRMQPLGDFITLVSGNTPSKSNPSFWGGETPWVSAKDMGSFWISDSEDHLTPDGASVASRLVPSGAVLLLTRGMTLHKRVPICRTAKPSTFNQDVKAVFPKAGISDRFLPYLLVGNHDRLHAKVDSAGHGTGRLNTEAILSFPVWVPGLKEQEGIADIGEALDGRITLLRKTNATLEAIAQALFKSWFVDFDPVRAKAEGRQPEAMDATTAALFPDSFEESELGLVPKGWTVARLGDVTERITKGTTPTTLKRPFVESGINFVKVESINDDGQLLPEKFAYIDDETHCLLGRSQLKADDVLITIAGTIGRVAVITEDFIPANTNQAVAIVRPDTSKLPSAFVNQFLRLADSKSRMGERVVQAVQANLSLGSLSDMRLVIPPSVVVTKLHDLVFDSIGSKRNSNQQCIRTLTQLRDTLLPRLISGQLRLPEAEATVEEVL